MTLRTLSRAKRRFTAVLIIAVGGRCRGLVTLEAEFGSRWRELSAALAKPKRYAAWANPFASGADAWAKKSDALLTSYGFHLLPGTAGAAHLWVSNEELKEQWLPKPPTCSETGLKMYYPLDLASAMPVLALVESTSSPPAVLDACSAPGGKLLLMAGVFLSSPESTTKLVAIEHDAFRLSRLKQNLRLYLPKVLSKRLTVLRGDASKILGRLPDGPFDAILVDAPCSSERERLLRALGRKGKDEPWREEKAKANSRRQVALLSSALRSAVGTVVYATCALSHIENDAVVQENGWSY
eukprot:Skav205584  [mRNA]  locus=scaffold460:90571:91720:+ [translate_table: standard]